MKNVILVAALCTAAFPLAAAAQTTTTPPAEATPPAAVSPAAPTVQPTDGLADTTVAVGQSSYVREQLEGTLFSSDLVGYDVYGIADEKIGDINDLLIGGDGSFLAVVIGVGGFLGLGEKDVAVPISELDIEAVDGHYRITIEATERDLTDAPSFARADGTSSDRIGAFERSYDRARAEAEAALVRAGELSEQAAQEAGALIEQGRQAIRDLTADEPATDPETPTAN